METDAGTDKKCDAGTDKKCDCSACSGSSSSSICLTSSTNESVAAKFLDCVAQFEACMKNFDQVLQRQEKRDEANARIIQENSTNIRIFQDVTGIMLKQIVATQDIMVPAVKDAITRVTRVEKCVEKMDKKFGEMEATHKKMKLDSLDNEIAEGKRKNAAQVQVPIATATATPETRIKAKK